MGEQGDWSVSAEPALPAARRRVRLPVVRAAGGDHATIFYFLQAVFQGPSPAEFQASLDDPFYEPFDRLLMRQKRRIVAHVHVTHRTMQFGPVRVPAAGLGWLGVAPEQRGQGLATHLLHGAERHMEISGALVGMLRTTIPHFFRRTGWALCGQPNYRRANPHAILARLLDRGMVPRPRRRRHIRPWLQWEHSALVRLYNQNVSSKLRLADAGKAESRLAAGGMAYGPLERTAAYWQWLLSRHGYDQVYVALEGPEQLELGEISTRVVGYVAIRGERIVELMTAPERPRAAAELLARSAGDAIEHGRHCLRLDAPPGSPLLAIFDAAGGCGPGQTPEHGEVSMMRLLAPVKLLRRLSGEFDRRASETGLPRPLELGLLVDGRKYQIELGREGATATADHVGRSYLRLNVADFTRLVLGQLDWDAALAARRLECSTALAAEAGRALFPPLPFWRPPWDDLPAM